MAPALAWLSPLCRLLPLLLLLPTARRLRGRAGLALLIALALTPLFAQHGPARPWPEGALLPFVLRELAVGAALGLWAALPLLAAQGAGALLTPLGGALGRPGGALVLLMTAAVYLSSGGPRLLVRGLAQSYQLIPLGAPPSAVPGAGLAPQLLQVLAQLPLAALALSAPLLLSLLLAALVLALLQRLRHALGARLPALLPFLLLALLVLTLPALFQSIAALIAAYPPGNNPLLPGAR